MTKIPGGPKAPPPPTVTPAAPAAKPAAPTPEPKPPVKADAFDAGFKTTGEVKLDDAFLQAASPSGIENLVRLLESARAQLLSEHGRLRMEAHKALEKLVQAGFSDAQLTLARTELFELRRRMAALRKRLQNLQRRLKGTFAHAGKTGDANLQKLLMSQLDRLKKLEPGVSRALVALSTIEQAYGSFSDGSTPVLRARVDEQGDANLVEALAMLAPGAVVSRAVHGLLRDGNGMVPDMPPLPEPRADEPASIQGLRAFAEAMLSKKAP